MSEVRCGALHGLSNLLPPPRGGALEVSGACVFSMVKGTFGDSVRSKSDVGQINEVLAKVLCHNMCVLIRATRDLGVEPIFGSGSEVEPKIFV
jgi:hypothetical protein